MSPLLDVIPAALTRTSNSTLRSNSAWGRMAAYSSGTVSTLWLMICGAAATTVARASASPRRSGMRTSTVQRGSRARTAAMVAAKCAAPPSGRSSRVTEVMTTWRRPRRTAASATRAGSPGSRGSTRPAPMLQKAHERVQWRPMMRNVATLREKHS
jgi:hypothetical protein